MKKSILLPILFALKLAYSQQTYLVNENFNGGLPAEWTHCSGNFGSSPIWKVDSGALKESSGPFFVRVLNGITLPAVDLTSISDPFIEFDFALAEIDSNTQFSVWYTTDTTCKRVLDPDGYFYFDSWKLLSSYSSSTVAFNGNWKPQSTDYQNISVDLSQFNNDSAIHFSFVSDYMNYLAHGVWYLDNVKIFGNSSTPISERSKSSSFEFFLNPGNTIVRIISKNPSDNATLRITDISGAKVLERKSGSALEEIDVSYYESGIYFIHYIYGERMDVKKFIIH